MGPRYLTHWYSERHLLVSPVDSQLARELVRAFTHALHENPPEAMLDLTPAAASLLVHFDPAVATPLGQLLDETCRLLDSVAIDRESGQIARIIDIPFSSTIELAPDLAACAQHAGLSAPDFLERFCATTYETAFVGFMPGFAYLSGLDLSLHVPRLPSPRQRVPAGSVAIAGDMAGIYPCASPGGWRLIGRTPRVMFDPARAQPALLEAGCRVRFIQIDPAQFETLQREQERAT